MPLALQRLNRTALFFVSVFVALTVSVQLSHSFENQWEGNGKSQMRLIGANAEWQGQTQLFAAIEIRLAPKWKTYWRSPGDTGIPPYFDWSGSENLKKAEVMYPVPRRFDDPTGMTIGYKSQVTLPVLLTPIDVSKPVKLKLSAQYAICYDLCVPVNSNQSLEIDSERRSAFGSVLSMALSLTPKPVTMVEKGLGVQAMKIKNEGKSKTLNVVVQVPSTAKIVDLFVEGPGGMYVPTPKLIGVRDSSSGKSVYGIDLTQVDEPAKFKDLVLTCTLRADDRAVVQPCAVSQ